MRGIQRRTAVVTGGATLIGQAVARAFSDRGANVALADIEANAPKGLPADAFYSRTDIREDEQIDQFVSSVAERFGGVDFLVNLACSYVDSGATSTRADWLEALDVNVVSTALMAAAVRPHMVARGGGAIVNFTSISAKVAQTGRWLYPASKAALMQLTRSMAMDFAQDGIRVNSISPGWTWSRIMVELTDDDRLKTDRVAAPYHLLRRVGDADEVAEIVVFLCSDHASVVTGADWAADGGYSAMGPEQAEPAIPKLSE